MITKGGLIVPDKTLIVESKIQAEVQQIVKLRASKIEEMLAEAMACRPWSAYKRVHRESYRDDKNHVEVSVWFHENLPFMTCKTHMSTITGQLTFKLERMLNEKTIIAKPTE